MPKMEDGEKATENLKKVPELVRDIMAGGMWTAAALDAKWDYRDDVTKLRPTAPASCQNKRVSLAGGMHRVCC